jgi:hypothetical protein
MLSLGDKMRYYKKYLILILLVFNSLPSRSEQNFFTDSSIQDSVLLEDLKQFSEQTVKQKPLLAELLKQLGVDYLHELDHKKRYRINNQTLEVSVIDDAAPAQIKLPAFIVPTAVVYSEGFFIKGNATTSVTCPTFDQTAEVSGIMSAMFSRRDPPFGVPTKEGSLITDFPGFSKAEVNFEFTKIAGGGKKNETLLETVHIGSCGNITETVLHRYWWPSKIIEMVIDDTGSMSEELGGLQLALADIIKANIANPDETRRTSYELITFKDEPTLRLANTEDTTAAIDSVNSLVASGGGDCPEDSIGALNLALDNLKDDEDSIGEIIFATDASPSHGNIDNVISTAKDLGVKVNVMLTGDCVDSSTASLATTETTTALSASVLSAREVFQRIASETGGVYYFRPSGTVNDYKEILTKIFESSFSTGGNNNPGAPIVTVSATPTKIWPPNHEWVQIDTQVTATDDKDPDPVIKLVGVTLNEPNDGQGDGNTKADYKITLDGKIYVRAERSGSGNSRFYTIAYQATDNEGNIGFGSADILVPHDQ